MMSQWTTPLKPSWIVSKMRSVEDQKQGQDFYQLLVKQCVYHIREGHEDPNAPLARGVKMARWMGERELWSIWSTRQSWAQRAQ